MRLIDKLRQAFCHHEFSAINSNCKHLDDDYFAYWNTCVKCGKRFLFTFQIPDAFEVQNSPEEEAEFNLIADGGKERKRCD